MDRNKLYDEQLELAKKSILTDSFDTIKRIGGVDCSYLNDEYIIGGLVVLDRDTLKPVYRTFEIQKLSFPYVPGLLAYREADAMMGAITKAKVKPDLLMVDGFGTNHPRRCGIATHIGIKLDMPAMGVGKSYLCGRIEDDDVYQDGEKVGKLIYSKGAKKPIYVSPGHKISLETAVDVASASTITGKIPEPVRLAHEYVTNLKQALAHRTSKTDET
jgi:deoxyribonuclease V